MNRVLRPRLAALVAAAGVLAVAACTGGGFSGEENEHTEAIEEAMLPLDGVEEVRARYHRDSTEPYLAVSVDLDREAPGSHAGAVPPLAHALRVAVEEGEYRNERLRASFSWRPEGSPYGLREITSSGPVHQLAALSNEAEVMLDVEQWAGDTLMLTLYDGARRGQYERNLSVDLPPSAPPHAITRLHEILTARVPETVQESTFRISRTVDYESDGPRQRLLFSASPRSSPEVLEAAGSVLHYEGWGPDHNLYLSVSAYGAADEGGEYASLHLTIEPETLEEAEEDELEEHASRPEYLDIARDLAELVAVPETGLFFSVGLGGSANDVPVAAFDSLNCSSAWEDESGRSREAWRAWVEAGGTPGEEATATSCPPFEAE